MKTKSPKRPATRPPVQPASRWERLKLVLGRPVDGSSLAFFRIAVGLVMALEAYALCRPNPAAISSGRTPLETYYTGADITFHFPFPAFSWMPLLPPIWIYAIVGLMAVAGMLVVLGLVYRVAAVTLFLAWGYLFVVESTRTYWQSHYYLEFLLTFLLIWLPAARSWSLDAWRAARRGAGTPGAVPFWPIFLLRGQLLIAYFYAGVAKLNLDWLQDAAPVRWFLAEPGVTAPYERFLSRPHVEWLKGVLQSDGMAYFFSYTGLVFDLAVGFLFLARRTRIFALVLMLIFHATNHFLIFDDIDWFPLVGAVTAFIFLDPDWPRRFWRWVRQPFVKAPDWKWFWPGIILFPGVGAALGWKLKAGPPVAGATAGQTGVSPKIAVFVVVWLALHALIPLRHYAIAGDARFTYEGMSFSWRLKAEVRRSRAHEILVDDPVILAKDAAGRTRINWPAWQGERVIYREITPGRIDWRQLPEIVVLLEPIIGERIVFNPHAGNVRSETAARTRVEQIWLELHGNAPENVQPTLPFPRTLELAAQSLKTAGRPEEGDQVAQLAARTERLEAGQLSPPEADATQEEIGALLHRLRAGSPGGSALRRTQPFTLEGEAPGDAPFLIIEDARWFDASKSWKQVDRKAWRHGPPTVDARRSSDHSEGGAPLVVYMGQIGSAAREMLPRAYFVDAHDLPGTPPRLRWNSARDLSGSKLIHTSVQAFYLRNYARRVAALWEQEYGRRPAVRAVTSVSLNGRPYQELVDPAADLGRVPAKWFRHNEWIRDLQTRRIPPEALTPGKVF